jgi:hypothetical protein
MEANKMLNLLFEMRDVSHIYHLQTNNYNDHKVLNEFYDSIVDLADEFAEQYQGTTGEIITSIGSISIKEGVIIDKYLIQKRDEILSYHSECEHITVKLVIESVLTLLNKTLYLLKLS